MSFISENFCDAIVYDDDYDPRGFDEADDHEDDICPACSGSGEGESVVSTCSRCGGSGVI